MYNGKGNFLKIISMKKNPELFNSKTFKRTILIINTLFSIYIIFSIMLYLFYHSFGDLGLFMDTSYYEQNPNLKKENEEYFKLNDEALFYNLFNCIFPVIYIIFSIFLMKNQTIIILISYIGILIYLNLGYFMHKNLTLIPNKNSFIFHIYNIVLIINVMIFLMYFIFSNSNNGQIKTNPKNVKTELRKENFSGYSSMDVYIHEMQLKMDMAKMRYNAFMIKLGLHKISKRFLYQKKDFYFMQLKDDKKKENENIKKNIQDLFNEKKENEKNNQFKKVLTENDSTTLSTNTIDNSYFKIGEQNNENDFNEEDKFLNDI